jgi:hypothetical protein
LCICLLYLGMNEIQVLKKHVYLFIRLLNDRIICTILYDSDIQYHIHEHIRTYQKENIKSCKTSKQIYSIQIHAFPKICMHFFTTKQFNIEMMGKCSGLK